MGFGDRGFGVCVRRFSLFGFVLGVCVFVYFIYVCLGRFLGLIVLFCRIIFV